MNHPPVKSAWFATGAVMGDSARQITSAANLINMRLDSRMLSTSLFSLCAIRGALLRKEESMVAVWSRRMCETPALRPQCRAF